MSKHLTKKLRQRGYKRKNIHSYISSVNYSDRANKLKKKRTKDSANRLVFSTKYCDNIHNLRKFLTECWKELHESEDLKIIFPDPPLIAFKKNPSLKNKLVRAKLPNSESNTDTSNTSRRTTRSTNTHPQHPCTPIYTGKTPPTFRQQKSFPFKLFPQRKMVKPCFKKLCQTCGKLNHSSNFVKSKVHKRCFPVKPFHNLPMTCQSTRLVYLIQCDKCQKQYVGQTTQTLHTRMNHHVQCIKKKTFSKKVVAFQQRTFNPRRQSDPTPKN